MGVKRSHLTLLGIPSELWFFALFWLVASLISREPEFSWLNIFLFSSGLISVGLIVFSRSFSIALGYIAVAVFAQVSIIPVVLNADAEIANLTQIVAVGLPDMLAVIALARSWANGQIRSSKTDWLALIAATLITGVASICAFLLAVWTPVSGWVFAFVVLSIGAISFVWMKRTLQGRSASDPKRYAVKIN